MPLLAYQRTKKLVDTITDGLNEYAALKSFASVSVTLPAISVTTILTFCDALFSFNVKLPT